MIEVDMDISVIVPVYKGKKYVHNIIRQLEECADYLDDDILIELILSNDYPEEPLDMKYESERINIITINTDSNCGIHEARVKGLQKAHGHYILFLDQDDRIKPKYFQSQLSLIGDNDFIVCACIHDGKVFYNENRKIYDVIKKDKILGEFNYIISPGQVLIRKDAIPKLWTENHLTINGADDWFLWILMFKENKSVAINENILFEHVINNKNASLNSWKMYQSEREILRFIKLNNILDEAETTSIENNIDNMLKALLDDLDKLRKYVNIYSQWTIKSILNIESVNRLYDKSINKIAIYGCNQFEKVLTATFECNGIQVSYYIDRDAKILKKSKSVYTLENELPYVDLVIIAVVCDVVEIKEKLSKKGIKNVITIEELLEIC